MTINITQENSVFLFIDIQEKLVGMLKDKINEKCKNKTEILAKVSNL